MGTLSYDSEGRETRGGRSILVVWCEREAAERRAESVGAVVAELENSLIEIEAGASHPKLFASRELQRLRDEAREALGPA